MFTDKTYYLDFPDQKAIEKTYLKMPEYGRVIITARVSSLFDVLTGLDGAGFFGILFARDFGAEGFC